MFHCRPCIWIPQGSDSDAQGGNSNASAATSHASAEVNGLGDLCLDISKTVIAKVQGNMSQCSADCEKLLKHIDKELREEGVKRGVKARWGRYVLFLAPWFLGLVALAFFDVLIALEPVLPVSVTQAHLTTTLLDWARPTVGVLGPLGAMFGLVSVTQRLLAIAAVFLAISILVQARMTRKIIQTTTMQLTPPHPSSLSLDSSFGAAAARSALERSPNSHSCATTVMLSNS